MLREDGERIRRVHRWMPGVNYIPYFFRYQNKARGLSYTLHGHKLRLFDGAGSAICDRGHYKKLETGMSKPVSSLILFLGITMFVI
jgi:hypothetical protein